MIRRAYDYLRLFLFGIEPSAEIRRVHEELREALEEAEEVKHDLEIAAADLREAVRESKKNRPRRLQ
jgi:hypothetical protein